MGNILLPLFKAELMSEIREFPLLVSISKSNKSVMPKIYYDEEDLQK